MRTWPFVLVALAACSSSSDTSNATSTSVALTTPIATVAEATSTTENAVYGLVRACQAAADVSLPNIVTDAPQQLQDAIDVCTAAQPTVSAGGASSKEVGNALTRFLLELGRAQLYVQSGDYNNAAQERLSAAILDFQVAAGTFLNTP